MNRYFRYFLYFIAIGQALLGTAFLLQMPFAVQVWTLPDTTPMSFIFISSIFAAAAASTLYCLLAKEYAGLAGIGLDYVVIFLPVSIYFLQLGGSSASSALTITGIMLIIMAIFGAGLFFWFQRLSFRQQQRTPLPVRISFFIFVVALIVVGVSQVRQTPNILPWRVTPELMVVFGWFFIGAAAYFTYGLIRPVWGNAAGQLVGFLAYDLVLIIPFLQRLPTIAPELQVSLIVYIIVVTYSGLLAIYYLFINSKTRVWGSRSEPAAQTT